MGSLLWLVTLSLSGAAQSFQVEWFTEAEGLPSPEVLSIAQAPDGVLWLTTRAGLVSFDGHEFVKSPEAGLSQGEMCLLIDEVGVQYRIRRSMGSDLSVGHPGDWRWIAAPTGADTKAVVIQAQLLERAQGTQLAIATTTSGVWLWSVAEGWQLRQVGLPGRLWGMEVADGQLYLAGEGGVARLDGDVWRLVHDDLPGGVLGLAIESAEGGTRLWCVGDDWLGVIEGESFRQLITLPDLGLEDRARRERRGVLALPDGAGGLWFGNTGSLARYDGTAGALRVSEGPLLGGGGRGATDMFRDRDDNVWVANLRGLARIPSMRFENWGAAQGLLENEVTALLERRPGELVLGHNNGISIIKEGQASVLAVFGGATSRPNESRVMDLALGRDGRIWMACTYFGLASLGADGMVRRHPLEDAGTQQVSAVAVDASGRLWVGTSTGLWLQEGERFVRLDEPGLPAGLAVRALAWIGDDELWCATIGDGVAIREAGHWRTRRHDGARAWNEVFAVHRERATGQTLLGTRAGLAVASEGGIVPLQRQGLEVSSPVYLLFEDSSRLWIGTQHGVISWDGSRASRYSVREGLAGNEINRAAGCVDGLGRTWFGTVNGASCYRAEHDRVKRRAPILHFAGVDVGGQHHLLDESLALEHDHNDLIFSIKAVSFAGRAGLEYSCRLEGFDEDWLPSSVVHGGSIRYTRLPPGDYRMLARARTPGGPWSEPILSAQIVIARPWWTEWWINPLAGLALTGLGCGVALLLGTRRRNRQLEGLVEERTRALRAAEEHYRGIFHKNLAPQLLVDGSDGAIVAVNQAAEEHYGQAAAALVGTTFVEVFADVDQALQRSLAALRPGQPLRLAAEQRIAGRQCPVEVHACTYELQGRLMIHATVFDVTEHRLVEEQLLHAQRMESVGRLAGGVAHDFNNLLTAVLGHAEMARLDLDDKGSLTEHLDVVASAAVRGARLTTQLLGFARQQPSVPRCLDIDVHLGTLDPVLQGLLREDIELRVELGAGRVGVHIDPGQLEQVLLNLVVNAVDAMPKGGVISLSTRRVPGAVAGRPFDAAVSRGENGAHGLSGPDMVCVAVEDSGVGMDADTRARIFDPFFTTKAVGEGTGLGLAMCDGIVRQNGGRLEAESVSGEGSRFEIYLPIHDGPIDEVELVIAAPPVSGAETILLVEDDPLVRDVAARTLVRLNYTVLQAADGEEALQLSRDHEGPIDLLVTDVIMPRLGGPDLARQLLQSRSGLAVLFMSGYTANALDTQGMFLDEINLLEKPFHTDELARRVRASLDRQAVLSHGSSGDGSAEPPRGDHCGSSTPSQQAADRLSTEL